MNEIEREKKIEKRICWNNDAQRDSLLTKRDKLLSNAQWYYIQGQGV